MLYVSICSKARERYASASGENRAILSANTGPVGFMPTLISGTSKSRTAKRPDPPPIDAEIRNAKAVGRRSGNVFDAVTRKGYPNRSIKFFVRSCVSRFSMARV